MDRMVEIVSLWPQWGQGLALAGLLVTAWLMWRYALWAMTVIVRGYPPEPTVEPVDRECHNDESLGRCLNPGGCHTADECDTRIKAHNLRVLKGHGMSYTDDNLGERPSDVV